MCASIIGISIGHIPTINTLPHSLTKLSMNVLGVKYFHLWMASQAIIISIYYCQINIKPPSSSHGGNFLTVSYHSTSRNVGANFQQTMYYMFHDIKQIVQPYLDDLLAHPRFWRDHPRHLTVIFFRCHFYKIRLNPHKCVFYVESVCLLRFVMFKDGIRLDPSKVEAIQNF